MVTLEQLRCHPRMRGRVGPEKGGIVVIGNHDVWVTKGGYVIGFTGFTSSYEADRHGASPHLPGARVQYEVPTRVSARAQSPAEVVEWFTANDPSFSDPRWWGDRYERICDGISTIFVPGVGQHSGVIGRDAVKGERAYPQFVPEWVPDNIYDAVRNKIISLPGARCVEKNNVMYIVVLEHPHGYWCEDDSATPELVALLDVLHS